MILMYFYINKYRINASLVIKRGFQNIIFFILTDPKHLNGSIY